MKEQDTLKFVSVNADCKKKKCNLKYNSDECKLRYITAGCFDKGLKQKKSQEKEK